ncbi:MAG TPA: SGNH/GDSL hydrolase family protein [Pyrinomonadaceae bacterium]|nr:SGNH/GDSL hydrolase family protein [Pyrinomonadaceae bacterium]
MKHNGRRVRKLFSKLLLIILGFLFGALIAEIALRAAGYSYPEFYELDQTRGYGLRPSAQGLYRKEGRSFVRINSDGLRDQEHSITKPPNTLRIALIGDSYAEALAVPLEQAFWSVMKTKLDECDAASGKGIEIINFGVSGYGTAQELLTLREKVWKYSPDVVMVAVTTNNDVTDNSRALKNVDEIPYFVLRDNQLVLDNSFQSSRTFLWRQSRINRFGRWLRNHSRLVQALTEGHRALKIMSASWRARWSRREPAAAPTASPDQKPNVANAAPDAEELGADNLIYREPQTEVWDNAWRVTESLITEMRNEVRARGAKFLLITLSNGPQVFPSSSQREALKIRFGATDLLYPDNRLRALCERENIPVITLAPELQQFAERNNVFLHGFDKNIGNGHWNVTGNRVAGELLAKKICEGALLK